MPVTNKISCLGSGIPINLCLPLLRNDKSWVDGHSMHQTLRLLNLQVVFQPSFAFISKSQIDMSLFKHITLQGTNISPKNGILKMIFLFPRWDMLIPWSVIKTTQLPDVSRTFFFQNESELDLRNFQQHKSVLICFVFFQGKRRQKKQQQTCFLTKITCHLFLFLFSSPGCRLHLSIWHHLGWTIHATWRPGMWSCLWWHHRWTAHWCTTRTRSHESTRTWRTWRNTRNTCAEKGGSQELSGEHR